jgi:hypothetical protein
MASTASPLPAPEPVQMAPLDLLALAAANGTHGLDPHIVAGVAASSNTVGDAVTGAQAATQATQMQDVVGRLNGQAPKVQSHLWSTMTGSEQQQLRSLGYTPPRTGTSLWHDIANVAEAPWRDVISPVLSSNPVHDVLQAAGAPLRAVQHGVRAASQVIGNPAEAQAAGMPDTGLNRVFSLRDWAQAWNVSSNGEQYLDPLYTRQAKAKYSAQAYNVAYQLATGKTPQDLLAGATSPQAQKELAQQISSPEVQDAYRFLNASHVSLGRGIVGPGFIARHPLAGNALSGVLDAVGDWYGDPLNRAGMLIKGAQEARYLVSTADDVQRLYDRVGSVQAAMADIADHVRSGDTTGLFSRYPTSKAAMEQLVAQQADDPEKVLGYFKSQAGLVDLIKGSPGNAPTAAGGILPHLTVLGRAKLAVKGTLQDSIDWTADRPFSAHLSPEDQITGPLMPDGPVDRLTTGVGRLGRRLTTLVPQTHIFNPNAPDAGHVLRDIALQFLPAKNANDIVTRFLQDPDIGAKWRIYRSLMVQMGEAAGLHRDPDLWDAHIAKFVSGDGRYYSTRGNDIVNVDDNPMHVGVLKNHQSTGWLIPSFKDLYVNGQKAGVTNALTRGVNREWMDTYMNNWRPLVLAHLGFAPRVGGEEAAGFVAREGFGAYMRGIAANVAAKKALRDAAPADSTVSDLVDNQVAGTFHRLTDQLPASVTDGITDGKSLAKQYWTDLLDRSFRGVAARMTKGDYQSAVDRLVEHGSLLPDDLTAMHGYDPGQIAGDVDGPRFIKVKNGTKTVNAEVVGSGDFQTYQNKDPLFKHMWYRALNEIANDDWGRLALMGARDGRTATQSARLARIADRLESDPMWKHSILSVQNRSGQLVAAGQITQRQAAEAHAQMIINHVGSLIRSPNGRVIGQGSDMTLSEYMLKHGKPPPMNVLDEYPRHLWPHEVQGPETVPMLPHSDLLKRAPNWLFSKVIGPQVNWISRQPMFIHHYAQARKAYAGMEESWLRSGMAPEDVEKLVHENSVERAVNQIIPFVHNPDLRSQMSTVTRNLAPFWFAQEQFYKRWARTASYAPATFRQAQLLSNGLRHSGLTQTDPTTGQTYFVYPGSQLVQEVLSPSLWWLHGGLPISPGLTGQTSMLSPAMTRGIGGPSFGPLAVVPMNALKRLDPHFIAAIDKVEGQQAANQGFLQSLLPTTVYRALEAADPNQFASAQYASAQMQAQQMMEATGHGLGMPALTQVTSTDIPNPKPGDYVLIGGQGPGAMVYQADGHWRQNTAHDLQVMGDRVKQWARSIFLTRLVFGFAAPASPEVQFDPSHVHADLLTMMKSMPIDQAVPLFLQQHPDATPYTIFQTQTKTGGFLPATQAAMNFLDENKSLTSNHEDAATYFIPPADTQGPFSQTAYQEQLATGLRVRKDPATFYDQVVSADAASMYYNAENAKFAMLAAKTIPAAQINDEWTKFSEQFLAANPVFADSMSSSGALKRQQIMDDVGSAIRDGSAPHNNQTTALGEVYNAYAAWMSMVGNFGNPNQPPVSSTAKMQIDEEFATWLQGFVQTNPGVKPLVDRAIRPDLSAALTDLAQQGVSVQI